MLPSKVNYYFTEKEREKCKWCAINKRNLIQCDGKNPGRFKLTNVNALSRPGG